MRSLHVFNMLLTLVAVALATAVARTILDRGPSAASTSFPSAAVTTAPPAPGAAPERAAPEPGAVTAADFDVILRQNLFGKPLPLPESTARPQTARAAPPPAPLPALIGTVIVGDERRALLKDGSRIDLFAPGDPVAGGTLVEIHADRIVVKRGESLGEVSLKTSIRPMPATPSPAATDATESRLPRRSHHRRPAVPQSSVSGGSGAP